MNDESSLGTNCRLKSIVYNVSGILTMYTGDDYTGENTPPVDSRESFAAMQRSLIPTFDQYLSLFCVLAPEQRYAGVKLRWQTDLGADGANGKTGDR